MTRTPEQAITWARAQIDHPVKDFTRLCLQFVRMAYGLAALHPDAGTAWDKAKTKHRTTDADAIPRGVPVFWELPSVADHVALSLGGGRCVSNDILRPGKVDVVLIDTITREWGATLQGWTEDLNGVTVWTAPKPPETPRWDRIVEIARDIARDNVATAPDGKAAREIVDLARHFSTKY